MDSKTINFIEKAKAVHGDKYDYSKVEYVKAKEKVCIICQEHGEFWQTPNNHLRGEGCPFCYGSKKLTTEEFISKAKQIHGNKYDYSNVNYVNKYTKVCIICPEHGEFWQTPSNHLQGNLCPKCAHQSYKDTNESFIEKARKVHGNKYDYSKVEYVNSHTKVCIICPEHGEFWMIPTNHLKGKGCKQCMIENLRIRNLGNKNEFIEKARKVHGDKYDYSKVKYVDRKTSVCIICPEHGEFWQTPANHLVSNGCQKCSESSLEREMRLALTENNIKFEQGKHFKWLKRQHLDFYLPDYNIAIECQGEQHFTEMRYKYKKPLSLTITHDTNKFNACKENSVNLIYYIPDRVNRYIKDKPSFYEGNYLLLVEDIINKIKNA